MRSRACASISAIDEVRAAKVKRMARDWLEHPLVGQYPADLREEVEQTKAIMRLCNDAGGFSVLSAFEHGMRLVVEVAQWNEGREGRGAVAVKASDSLAARGLPPGSRVEQRVAKKPWLKHGAPTAADRRLLTDGIAELIWIAALEPATVGIAQHRDEQREVLEIAGLLPRARAGAKAQLLLELVHRAIPYPLLLVVEPRDGTGLSAVHERRS